MESEPGGESLLLIYDQLLLLNAATSPIEVGIASVLCLFLLLASALVSGSEVAYFSLDNNDVEEVEKDADKTDKRITDLLNEKEYLLATILVTNNFINVAIIMLSAFVLGNLIPEGQIPDALKFLIEVVLVTFLLVLFGEVSPKVYASTNNIRVARLMARPLTFLRKLTFPISALLVNSTSLIERRIAKRYDSGKAVSMEDIDQAIELAVTDTQDAKQDIRLLKSIVKFGNVSVKQIMRSRVDVTAVEQEANFEELLELVRESGYSRIPVYDDNFDNVTGVLYAKDLLEYLDENSNFKWQKVIRSAFFVPETKKIDDLLQEFQERRIHIAIVVDEYGGTLGIVTLEDVLEEIIGEIKDEFDDQIELEYEKIDEFNYKFEGKTLLNDLCRVVGLDTATFDEVKGESDSMAGLVLELAGRIPKVKEQLEYKNYLFTITEADKRRIIQVKMTIAPEAETSGY